MLDTDASNVGIGAVLSQIQDGEEKVVAYGSRALTRAERNYCTTRRELLAVVHFTDQFRHFLLGGEFLVRTDNTAVKYMRSIRHQPVGQVARWLEKLHRPGHKHANVDGMSRPPFVHCVQCNTRHIGGLLSKKGLPKEVTEVPVTSKEDSGDTCLQEVCQ